MSMSFKLINPHECINQVLNKQKTRLAVLLKYIYFHAKIKNEKDIYATQRYTQIRSH